ncbi:hypothetical protein T069G_03994 [Trichoderma breve]|uniref:Membrane anchor Opy2 N-terminal domain-containing protein n=1 Tax=Trichoderma breve TaxID=2034170 RepID=A0A9W9BMC4_9HYPO|nr:hypothetical protein T069G_03994 [Trichoderma breve]KAJ4863040.1 hypothetical protein T069G_03994 [Trichoderma breve]
MDTTSYLVARDLTELHQVMRLVPRKGECVKCDDTSKLQCPSCASNESCHNGGGGGGGPSAGPIAGGVIGGIAAIAIITYLVWRFLIKPKRRLSQSVYGVEEAATQGGEKNGNRVTRRGSTHTVHSIASTVLTRASNIIQIAYIPGVTNRATPASPNVLVPPVPPIPMHHTEGYRDSGADNPHFFVPGNLRDSTYSGISAFSDRTSFAPPRSSIASTIFGGGKQQVLTPAQTVMRAKPTMVSVKSGASAPGTPPVPSIDYDKFNPSKTLRPQSAASNFSVGSTFLNNANTVTQARAQVVKVGGSGLRMVEIASKPESQSSTTLGNKSPKTTDDTTPPTSRGESSTVDQGPFSDPPDQLSPKISVEAPPASPGRERGSIKEGDSGSQKRDSSPFGDEHETKD